MAPLIKETTMPRTTIHLIANAHLDPVWLWDWREGMNEGITTCRTILDLMEEFPELTFIRGEAAVYHYIQHNDSETFRRISARIEEGRWDVVGGNWIQPDTNLPATELLLRQFEIGRGYFKKHLGREVRVAWAADSFGHSAGLPDILAASGFESIAMCRPPQDQFPLAKPAFFWKGRSGAEILAYRPDTPYLTERDEVPPLLDKTLIAAEKHGLHHIPFFYGLGNHGGGPTRRHLRDIRRWADAHPEVEVVHSGLHRFFDALRGELRARHAPDFLPVVEGELNFCLRGCYASVAKFKFPYRKMEAELLAAERTDAVIRCATGSETADFSEAWQTALFNGFHDILPGSSIERAYEDQLDQVGAVRFQCQQATLGALNALAARINTQVAAPRGDHPAAVPVLLWNPHPWEYSGPMEFEVPLDYRLILSYRDRVNEVPLRLLGADRKPRAFQCVATEHTAFPALPWRKRVVTQVRIPAFGWNLVELGWVEGAVVPATVRPATAPAKGIIRNEHYKIEACAGRAGLRIFHRGKPLFDGRGISFQLFEDLWGSWGGMFEEPDSFHFGKPMETWKITDIATVESGPERAALWVRFAGKHSWLGLTVSLCAGREAVDVSARLLWNERGKRLKMVFPVSGAAEYEVPGGTVRRKPGLGEVPGGRWVRLDGKLGFASDGLYSFDSTSTAFRPTIARASRYAATRKTPADAAPWQPAVDCGELKFRFLIQPGNSDLPGLAAELEQPPSAQIAIPGPGPLPRTGSLASLSPHSLRLLTIRAAGRNTWLLRAQSFAALPIKATLRWQNAAIPLGMVPPGTIKNWNITKSKKGWLVEPLNTKR